MELSDRFVQIFYIFCHGGRSNRLPCFLDDECLASFLDAHLLQEHVHDNEYHNREQYGVIFNLVDFKDDELLIEEVHVQVGVQGHLQFATPVELLQDGSEVADVELNLLLCHDLRNALQSKLVVGIEGQFPDFQSAFLLLDVVYLLVYLDKHGVVVEFLLVVLDNLQGTFLFSFAGSFILGKGIERTALAEQLESPGFCRKHECSAFRLLVHFGFSDLGINVFHAVGELVVVFFHLGSNQQLLSQPLTFLLRKLGKGMEVGFVVFHDGLVDEHVLNLTWEAVALKNEEDE